MHAFKVWEVGFCLAATAIGTVGCAASAEAPTDSEVAAVEQTALGCGGIHYSVTELGSLAAQPGETLTFVGGLNDRAQVVGVSDYQAFRWQPGKTMSALATLSDVGSTYALGVNNSGLIVGASSAADFHSHAVSWQNGKITDLGTGGGPFSWAYDVNDRGHIVGYAGVPGSDSIYHAFLYRNGVMEDLGTAGGEVSYAVSINERSQAVGFALAPNGAAFAAFWHDGEAEAFAGVDAVSYAYDINDRGQIVGDIGDGLAQRAFVFQNGEFVDIGAPGEVTFASGINNRGVIVGITTHDEPIRDELSFFETYEGFVKMGDSFELLRHVTDGCWNLLSPVDVNERGQIAAVAYPCDGVFEVHPLLLTPSRTCAASSSGSP